MAGPGTTAPDRSEAPGHAAPTASPRAPHRRSRALLLALVAVAGLAVLALVLRGAGDAGPDSPPAPPRPVPAPGEPGVVLPEDHGAVGDPVADDTAALQRALDELVPGETLLLAEGRTYRHSDVLTVEQDGVRLTGPGVLLATAEERSAVRVAGDDVVLDGGLVLRMGETTRRWVAYEQMKLRLTGDRITVRDVRVEGSAAAGIFVDGAGHFHLEDVTVTDTRADGIHMTDGAHDGRVVRPVVRGSGDDGVAVVSYDSNAEVSRDIVVESPTVTGTTWGRGVTVVGGEDVVYRDVRVEDSAGGGLYVASEGEPYNTHPTRRVTVEGAVLVRSNTRRDIDHGAVVVYAARRGFDVEDVTVTDLRVVDTRRDASRQIGVLAQGGQVRDVVLRDVVVEGGGGTLFSSTVPRSELTTEGFVVDGRPVADPVA